MGQPLQVASPWRWAASGERVGTKREAAEGIKATAGGWRVKRPTRGVRPGVEVGWGSPEEWSAPSAFILGLRGHHALVWEATPLSTLRAGLGQSHSPEPYGLSLHSWR